jgi:hypothetical protein
MDQRPWILRPLAIVLPATQRLGSHPPLIALLNCRSTAGAEFGD